MGKGDKKSRKGKITIGSYGVKRRRAGSKVSAINPAIVHLEEKKPAAKKPAAKKPAAKKTSTKAAKPASKATAKTKASKSNE